MDVPSPTWSKRIALKILPKRKDPDNRFEVKQEEIEAASFAANELSYCLNNLTKSMNNLSASLTQFSIKIELFAESESTDFVKNQLIQFANGLKSYSGAIVESSARHSMVLGDSLGVLQRRYENINRVLKHRSMIYQKYKDCAKQTKNQASKMEKSKTEKDQEVLKNLEQSEKKWQEEFTLCSSLIDLDWNNSEKQRNEDSQKLLCSWKQNNLEVQQRILNHVCIPMQKHFN